MGRLGIRFLDEELRETALIHRSYAFEHGVDATNERLEFLGDSVLGLVVTDMAFEAFPNMPEGELAKLRAAIVNAQALADVARSLRTRGAGPARQGGRAERWPGQGEHPGRCPRGRHRGRVPRSRTRRDPPADRAALPPAHGGLRPGRGRPRLQDDPAGARLPRAAHDAGVPPGGARTRSREGVHGDRVPRRRADWARASAGRRRRPNSGPPARRSTTSRSESERRGTAWSCRRSR